MQNIVKYLLFALILVVISIGGALISQNGVLANEADPPPRQQEIVIAYSEYSWWLTSWSNNEVVCGVPIDHEGIPTNLEVLAECGETLYQEWINTPACPAVSKKGASTKSCQGFYLFLADIRPAEKTLIVDLPTPSVWLSLSGCEPTPPKNECEQIPILVLEAEEPLPNEEILAVHVLMNGQIRDCGGGRCEIPLGVTRPSGEEIEFWADSTYGDESKHFTARIRILDGGVAGQQAGSNWFVDIISSQWRGDPFNSCATSWEAFPPIGEIPLWLSSPEDPDELSSDTPFVFLAAQLIRQGLVDASQCPADGLLVNGAANPCGVQAARALVNDWQDQFDRTIFDVARDANIPSQLLKNLFAQESQFWPGAVTNEEFGLGQLTEMGADTTLLWNIAFFDQFCPLVFHEETCGKGYAHLADDEQTLLRGALAAQSGSNCSDCPQGIDLAHASSTIDVFAQTILANCDQVSYMVYDTTKELPGVVSTYEDLWRYTLVNYNAGPGCLGTALDNAWRRTRTLNWRVVAENITAGCEGGLVYVDRVTNPISSSDPDFLATLTPLPTEIRPTPTITTFRPTVTPTPTQPGYPVATPTQSGYPIVTPTQSGYPIITPTLSGYP